MTLVAACARCVPTRARRAATRRHRGKGRRTCKRRRPRTCGAAACARTTTPCSPAAASYARRFEPGCPHFLRDATHGTQRRTRAASPPPPSRSTRSYKDEPSFLTHNKKKQKACTLLLFSLCVLPPLSNSYNPQQPCTSRRPPPRTLRRESSSLQPPPHSQRPTQKNPKLFYFVTNNRGNVPST
jgi:hypothetical protein